MHSNEFGILMSRIFKYLMSCKLFYKYVFWWRILCDLRFTFIFEYIISIHLFQSWLKCLTQIIHILRYSQWMLIIEYSNSCAEKLGQIGKYSVLIYCEIYSAVKNNFWFINLLQHFFWTLQILQIEHCISLVGLDKPFISIILIR